MVHPSDMDQLEQARSFWRNHADVVTVDYVFDYFNLHHDLFPIRVTSFQPCRQLFRGIGIHWNGDIPVCSMSEYRHGSPGVNIGNICRQSLAAIWQCATLRTYREAHITGDLRRAPGCDGCPSSC